MSGKGTDELTPDEKSARAAVLLDAATRAAAESCDRRTPEAKKWPDDYIPPQTCPAIDDAQNALELLRDTNSQLRHAANHWRRLAGMASCFDILPYDRARRPPAGQTYALRVVQVVRRSQEPEAWAIWDGGACLNRDLEWEHESLPSNRTDDFIARTRWPTASDAMGFARRYLRDCGYAVPE